MDSSFWFDIINMRWSILYIEGSKVIHSFQITHETNGIFVLANSLDSDLNRALLPRSSYPWDHNITRDLAILTPGSTRTPLVS